MGGEIEMKWMNKIKIVGTNLQCELGGTEENRGILPVGRKRLI